MYYFRKRAFSLFLISFVYAFLVLLAELCSSTGNISTETKTQDKLKLNFSFGLALLQGNTESLLINSDLNFNWTLLEEKAVRKYFEHYDTLKTNNYKGLQNSIEMANN